VRSLPQVKRCTRRPVDRAAFDAFAERRRQLTKDAEGSGSKIAAPQIYEVTYRS